MQYQWSWWYASFWARLEATGTTTFYILEYSFLELRRNALRKSHGSTELSMWRKICNQKKGSYYCTDIHLANVRWDGDEIFPLGPTQTENAWKKRLPKYQNYQKDQNKIECLVKNIYAYIYLTWRNSKEKWSFVAVNEEKAMFEWIMVETYPEFKRDRYSSLKCPKY